MIKIGLIGTGNWGKNYIHTIKNISDTELCWTATRNYKDVLNLCDAVIIATPSETHYQIVKDCLNSNKDVLVEKPFTKNSKEALELVNLANEKNKILMVGHLFLYHSGIKKLKELIDDKYFGDIWEIHSKRLSMNNGIDALWEMSPHDFYIHKYFFNIEFNHTKTRIYGSSYHRYIMLEYPEHDRFGRIKSSIELCTLYPKKIRQIAIIGNEKTALFDDTQIDKLKIYNYNNEEESIFLENRDPLENQCQHFLNCITNRTNPISGGIEGYENIKIIEKLCL